VVRAGDRQGTEQHPIRDVPGHPHPAGVRSVSLLARSQHARTHDALKGRVRSSHRSFETQRAANRTVLAWRLPLRSGRCSAAQHLAHSVFPRRWGSQAEVNCDAFRPDRYSVSWVRLGLDSGSIPPRVDNNSLGWLAHPAGLHQRTASRGRQCKSRLSILECVLQRTQS